MTAKIIAWLFGTAMGRGVLLGASISIGIAAGWYIFSSHYETVGYNKCQSEHQEALNKANTEQAEENARKNELGSAIAKDAAENAANVVKDAEQNTTTTKEGISDAYKDPPRTAPVVLGSCVHPVDDRVQDRIDAAVRKANATAR